jgi:peptidoglycan/LPS O-acetylase OafA/YrhL
MDQAAPQRYVFLDGLRGWAAVMVVLYHIFCDGFPLNAWAATELRKFVPFNGMIAVDTFFLVSGFALSVKFIATGERSGLLRMAVGRYLRLAIPILVACAAVHLMLVSGAIPPASERPPPFDSVLAFEPDIGHLLRFSLYEVFVSFSFARTYIGPLWTIPIEALGSVLVLGTLAVVGHRPWRWAVYLALLGPLLAVGSQQALFVMGILLAELHARRWQERLPPWVFVASLLVGCGFSFVVGWANTAESLLGVTAFCVGCIGWAPLRRLLSGRLSAALGTLSFPLYLAHGPMMFAVGIPLTQAAGGDPVLKVLAGVAVVGVSVLAALPLISVNEFAIRLARRMGWVVTSPGLRAAMAGR